MQKECEEWLLISGFLGCFDGNPSPSDPSTYRTGLRLGVLALRLSRTNRSNPKRLSSSFDFKVTLKHCLKLQVSSVHASFQQNSCMVTVVGGP